MIPTDFGNSLAAFYDATDISTLFKDTAATTPVTANGDVVKCWVDKSALAPHNAIEATNGPTYLNAASGAGGTPSLKFDGVSQKLTSSALFNTNFGAAATIICVCANNIASNRVVWGDGAATSFLIRIGAAPSQANYTLSGLTARTITSLPAFSGLTIEAFRYNGSVISYYSPRPTARRDQLSGSGAGTYQQVAQTGNWTPTGGLSLGNVGGGSFWDGEIKYFAAFTKTLTNKEFGALLDSISSKFGIANKPLVVCLGDSLIDGQGVAVGSTVPEVMQTNLGANYIVERSSGPGATGQNIFDWFDNDDAWRSWPVSSNNKQVMVLLTANDIAVGNGGLESAKISFKALCLRCRAEGFYVVVVTPPPRNESGSGTVYEAKRVALSTWIGNQTNLYDGIVRLDLNATIGVAGSQNNVTYYQADAVHLTAAGDAVLEGLIRPVVLNVLNNIQGPPNLYTYGALGQGMSWAMNAPIR